jgi:hypothetical protein
VHGSPAGPSLEKKGLRFDGKVLRAEGQAEPPWAMLSCSGWSLRQHCICAQSDREVHRASTSDGISGGQPNRVQPRRSAQKKTTSQFTSSCFGQSAEQYCSARSDSLFACQGYGGSDSSFFFSASIHASIRFRMPLSEHSPRSFSSRSISALICVISPGESMAEVYDTEQK